MKNFNEWSLRKKKIHSSSEKLLTFKERDICYAKLGINIGFEQDGKGEKFHRPVLILRKFSKYSALVIPLTSVKKTDQFHFTFSIRYQDKKSYAILSQIRLIDARRLTHTIGEINKHDFKKLKAKTKECLKL